MSKIWLQTFMKKIHIAYIWYVLVLLYLFYYMHTFAIDATWFTYYFCF